MAIVATRDGEILCQHELKDEQQEMLWAMVFRSFVHKHPDLAETGGQDAAEASTSPA